MANVRVSFGVLKGVTPEQMIEVKLKPVFKYVGTHIISDTKTDINFTRKARLVARGYKTETPIIRNLL